jgi:predicted CXXCH cytochrome family protein
MRFRTRHMPAYTNNNSGNKHMRFHILAVFAALVVAVVTISLAPSLVVCRGTPSQQLPHPTVVSIQVPVEPAPRPIEVVGFADGCLTSECHSSMEQRAFVHQTVTDQACDLCHMPDTGGHVYPQLTSTESTCASCHNTGAEHQFQHQAPDDNACIACHDPHGSDAPMLLALGTAEATCILCHPKDRGSVAHEPYAAGWCGECHGPHGANNAMLLVGGDVPNHCGNCHAALVDSMEMGSNTHLAVEGSCLGCHEAHSGHQDGLLKEKARALCVSCHEDIGQTVAGAKVLHDSVLNGDQCLTCHDPHTSEQHAMLRETQAQVCFSCHDKPVIASDGRELIAIGSAVHEASVVHGAVSIGQCSDCHSVHGGTHNQLLQELNPTVFVGPFDIQNYALCFSCHDKHLVESSASGATMFRDGDVNLHSTHLRAHNQAGGCSECHSVHAGNQPRLVVKTVRYQGSEWSMPMNFEITTTGGSCAPACHVPLQYDRRFGGAGDMRNGDTP